MSLIDVHNDGCDTRFISHDCCPDLNCCICECRVCKRSWEAAGRPRSENCKIHNKEALKQEKLF